MSETIAAAIDAILPQTQCGMCDYPDCKSYANAIANGEKDIAHCAPGGERVLKLIAKITNQDPAPHIEFVNARMRPKQIMQIKEEECIGCTKCIQACPIDAIIGGRKNMHTILSDICSGCELCIEPCPTDCITTIKLPNVTEDEFASHADAWQKLYNNKTKRISKNPYRATIKSEPTEKINNRDAQIKQRQEEIQAAILRSQNKRMDK